MARKDEDLRGGLRGVLANKQAEEKRAETQKQRMATEDEWKHLTIRVRRSHRKHWSLAAKREDTDLTTVITQFLTERYGVPPEGQL